MSSQERRPEFTTSWGAPRKRVYGPADVPPDSAAGRAANRRVEIIVQ